MSASKVCPVFYALALTAGSNAGQSATLCLRERCEWWTSAYQYEGDRPAGPLYACAITIKAMSDSDGRIQL